MIQEPCLKSDPKEIGVECQGPAVECDGSGRRSLPLFHHLFTKLSRSGWMGWVAPGEANMPLQDQTA